MNTQSLSPASHRSNAAAPLLTLSLLVFLALAHPLFAAPTYQIVALEDDPSPDFGGGTSGVYENFLSGGAISSGNHILIGGLASGVPVGSAFRGAFWFRPGGTTTVELAARVEDPAPGTVPAMDFSSIAAPLTPTGPVNASGQFAFRGGIVGSIVSGINPGIWFGDSTDPANLQLVAIGGAATGIGGGVLYEEVFGPVLSDTGAIAFRSDLQGGSVTSGDDRAIFAGTPGTALTLVAREGSAAPGGVPAGATFSNLFDPVIDPSGNVGFCAATRGPSLETGSGFWAGPPNAVQPLVKQGDPAPGYTPGSTFSGFDLLNCGPSWNGTEICFQHGTDDNLTFRTGIWAGTPGSLTLIAAEGFNAPGMAIPIASFTGNPVLSASGHVAFRAVLDTATNDHALFYGPINNVQLLVREGDAVPGLAGSTVSSFSLFQPLEMAPDGRLAFNMSTSPSGSDRIFLATPDNNIILLAGDDLTIDIAGQSWDMLAATFINSGNFNFFLDNTGYNGSEGKPSAFGAGGKFLLSGRMRPSGGGSTKNVVLLADTASTPAPLILPDLAVELRMPGANDVRITVETVSGQNYTLYRADQLQNWIPIAGPFPGTGGAVLVDDLGILANPENYYRAVTQ